MKFHGYFRSSASWRCRIAFNLKALQPETAFVHLRKGEQRTEGYRALNPQGLVPTLELDSGGVITQSLPIIEWLDEIYPEPPLLPTNPELKARVRSFAQVIACDIHPLQNLRVLNYLRSEYEKSQEELDRWCQRWLLDGLSACEILASKVLAGPYCFGSNPSLADICLVPQLASAERFGVNLAGMPRLRDVGEACAEHPAFAAALPHGQPDAEQ